ncbi:MAG: outer membrane protein assembly factor BamD [Candidatus Dependentiae bacterium]|jgi:outer membrane assembly lipoprotein YfiO
MHKKKYTLLLLALSLFALNGCKKDAVESDAQSDQTKEEQDHRAIFVAHNNKNYDHTLQLIGNFLNDHTQSKHEQSLRLMMADVLYEQESYHAAYDAYRSYEQNYPASPRAEYAAYKAAHAKFNQANRIECDSTPTEETVLLCQEYKARSDYQQYRRQIEDLENTCQQRLVDKEFYVANTYMTQQRFASARKRLEQIEEKFDLDLFGGADKLNFYKAKLAKQENNTEALAALIGEMEVAHPQSKFTAMAQQLNKPGLFFS